MYQQRSVNLSFIPTTHMTPMPAAAAADAPPNPAATVDDHGEVLLTKELNQLSFKDRNDYQDEIHCVKCLAIDETPDLIDKSLHELQIEIDYKIPDLRKNAYLHSQLTVKGRSFVNSKEFRLRFLRFELFDIQKSAIRMLQWLELALSLFGSVALERPIRMSDFTIHELKIFRKGYIQLLPVRAYGTGRRILCFIPYDEEWYTISKQVIQKIVMYIDWILGNDIDTQRKGVAVILMFDSSFRKKTNAGVRFPTGQLILSIRMSAIHICTPDTPFFRLRRSLVIMVIGSHNRSRLKLHIGTSIEIRYLLQVYGIPIECIPLTYTGKIKLSNIRQWIRLRNMIEDAADAADAADSNSNTKITTNITSSDNIVVESPYLGDVLFKQGDAFTSHPGNNMLRNLIECKLKQLHEVEVENNNLQLKGVIEDLKKTLVLEIMDEIEHKHQGRFLYWHKSNIMSDCCWLLLRNGNDQKIIFNKIDFLFRRMYSKKQQQQKVIKTNRMTGQNNSNRNEKRKFECNYNDSLITIDSTTINQNGGTFLFHSLDGNKCNNDSSECFGMQFIPCSTDHSRTQPH